MSYRKIELPVYLIMVEFDPDVPGAGNICCDIRLYQTCRGCGQRDCLYQCDGSHLGEIESEDDVAGRIGGNARINAILSLILAHACAGINVESPAYLEGVETSFDTVTNSQ